MPFAKSGKYNIHYQIIGQGKPLVLYHWSLTTLTSWYELGYVDQLKSKYKLILPDALGHGKSDTPYGLEHYTLKQRVYDLVAVLNSAYIESCDFYGFSMGGWVGFGLPIYAPEKFNSIMIGAAHPFDSSMQPIRDLIVSGIENGMETFINDFESFFGKQTENQKEKIRQFDLKALLDVAQDRENLESHFPAMSGSKIFLLVGENDLAFDSMKRCHQKLKGSTLKTFPDLDHAGLCIRPNFVVSNITKFIERG
ncbi:MAG: alpha/beta fold hydrolase [Desulfobacterales bacterium]|nr:alpha/beta fold hydrolase [Desulfobacterales bacterium]